ncbi:MAG: MFS transporter [Parachlamydiales bacterium]|nr:MFS transporter [Parachlamydiales bacterium]
MHVSHSERALLPLFLVVLIDSMGFGFLFPVLTPLFLHGHSPLLPDHTSMAMTHFYYGLVVAMYPLFMFFGAPLLGDISDAWGRKRVLLICLMGTGLGYLICAVGITSASLILLILGRVIGGVTAATLPMAQAAVADVSRDAARQAKAMGWMMFAIAGGQVLGPFLAGLLSEKALSSFFTNATPFYFAVGLALLNILWLMWAFDETYRVDAKKLDLLKTLRSYKHVVENKKLLLVTLAFLCMQFDWSFFSQSSPAYLQKSFEYGHFELGMFSSSLGLLIAIGGGFLTPRLAMNVAPRKAAIISMLVLAIGTILSVSAPNQTIFWIATALCAVSAAVAFSFIITLFSGVVDKTKQGWVMGISGAVIAFAWAVTALFSGILLSLGSAAPNLLGGVFGVIGFGLLLKRST